MKTISLNGIWQLKGCPQDAADSAQLSLSADVPGCVQLDLSKNGYLPADLYMGENIKETEKFEDWQWWYTRTFTAPEERENVYLVFEGVDCIAEYFLNGQQIGQSQNMLIAQEFEIGNYLVDGENTLTVHILSAVLAANDAEYTVHSMMSWGSTPVETAVRRAPHTYGWDIMPRAVTAGLWRDVKIEIRDAITFSQLYFHVNSKDCTVMYELKGSLADLKNTELVFKGQCGEDSAFEKHVQINGIKAARVALDIPNPKIWWPYGYGEPNVYDVTAQILHNGILVHEETAQFGLRSVVLDRTDTTDGVNGRFRFLINGVEILCKGSNWVPLDAFHCRDAQRYDQALAMVKDIGCNILRCWGGNVYEDHTFYNFCDRNGIMVWQDFSMACRIYPETEGFKKELFREAVAVIRKLRNHPSIILWAGDNEIDENLSGFTDPAVNSLTREVLPKAVSLNDLNRPYLPSSPYISSEAYANRKNGCYPPEAHLWGPRDYFKSDYYKNSPAHFVSETGYHGCPSLESIQKFITPEKVWPYHNNSQWILHSSDQKGNDSRVMLMEKQVRQLFGEVPADPESYILASQISQAEAKKYFIERIRTGRPRKTGIIWWNLLDGWPQMSDAVVDYYFTRKLAYGYIKRSQAPFTIAAGEIASWMLPIYACNDTLIAKSGHFTVTDARTDQLLLESSFSVEANTAAVIGKLPLFYSEHKMLIFRWEAGEETGFNHYLCGYPPVPFALYKDWMRKYGL